jgi:two-component system sensor histidine kinase CiaH
MIARLRKKFIAIAMGSVILVLVVLMGAVNVANYVRMDSSAEQVLSFLADNGGAFPNIQGRGGKAALAAVDSSSDDSEAGEDSESSDDTDDSDDTDESEYYGKRGLSAETPYETRFFSVRLDGNGGLVSVNTGKIAAVSTDEAVSMAQSLNAAGKTGGYSGSYKYVAEDCDGGKLYIFLDCTHNLSSFRNFLYISILVSLCGVAAVFLLVVALSKRAIAPVAESYEKQKQFITDAGHEIKTPLAIIDSCTEVIEMEQGENKWTQGIRGQVKRLTSLTQSLVSLARMDEGGTQLVMSDFNMSEAVADALAPFSLLAESRGLSIETDIAPDITLRGSEQAIRQLCSILADNAVKYASDGSEIIFRLSRSGKKIFLSSDNAADGLTPGDKNVLFDRFYRGDASRSSEKGGYGIGLSMARSIAAAHGGKATARSDGKRLTITIQL